MHGNPVCLGPTYRPHILVHLPELLFLDDLRILPADIQMARESMQVEQASPSAVHLHAHLWYWHRVALCNMCSEARTWLIIAVMCANIPQCRDWQPASWRMLLVLICQQVISAPPDITLSCPEHSNTMRVLLATLNTGQHHFPFCSCQSLQ